MKEKAAQLLLNKRKKAVRHFVQFFFFYKKNLDSKILGSSHFSNDF